MPLVFGDGVGTSGESATLKAADAVATHVDAVVMRTVQQQIKAIKELATSSPELVDEAKRMFYDYLHGRGLIGPELEAVGIPRGFFNQIETANEGQADYFYAASRHNRATDFQRDVARKIPPSQGEAAAFRGDDDLYSPTNQWGYRKSHITPSGDLSPADPAGIYEGRKVSITQHIHGKWAVKKTFTLYQFYNHRRCYRYLRRRWH